MIGLVTDWANHYSQQVLYLRLNGVSPLTARGKCLSARNM